MHFSLCTGLGTIPSLTRGTALYCDGNIFGYEIFHCIFSNSCIFAALLLTRSFWKSLSVEMFFHSLNRREQVDFCNDSYSSRTRRIWADIYNQRGGRPSWLLSAHIRQVLDDCFHSVEANNLFVYGFFQMALWSFLLHCHGYTFKYFETKCCVFPFKHI